MTEVAELIRAAMTGDKKREVTQRIVELRKGFRKAKYSFSDSTAYFFRYGRLQEVGQLELVGLPLAVQELVELPLEHV